MNNYNTAEYYCQYANAYVSCKIKCSECSIKKEKTSKERSKAKKQH